MVWVSQGWSYRSSTATQNLKLQSGRPKNSEWRHDGFIIDQHISQIKTCQKHNHQIPISYNEVGFRRRDPWALIVIMSCFHVLMFSCRETADVH